MALKRTRLFLLTSAFCLQASAATIVIDNQDAANLGFNDPTPSNDASISAQRGNNPGATLGEMRLKVFEEAAVVWGAILNSNVTITVDAAFESQGCAQGSATLGQAGATANIAGFSGSQANTTYAIALAESLHDSDLNAGDAEIFARFNIDVDGDPNCLGGGGFYYGLDDNVPDGQSALFPVVLHELGHGLGFQSLTTEAGVFVGANGYPDSFSRNLEDITSGKAWSDMTAEEREASSLSEPDLVWTGATVTAEKDKHLGPTTELVINAPGGIAGTFDAVLGAEETIIIPPGGLTAGVLDGNDVMDNGGDLADGCEQIGFDANQFAGKIVIFDDPEPACPGVFPAFFSEFSGAGGVIIVAKNPGEYPDLSVGISNQEITIPYIGVEKAVGDSLRANLGSANVTIRYSSTKLEGVNQGLVKMYAPATYESGSSVSHWSKSATPDLLMEPALGFLTFENVDLTAAAFQDIGWSVNIPGGVLEVIYEDGFESP